MTNERNPRTQPPRPRPGGPPPEWQKIPLPPLPRFRREPQGGPEAPAADRGPGVSSAESDLLQGEERLISDSLLPPGPRHEGSSNPALDGPPEERCGAIGASVMNDLVDEIERDIERDLSRSHPEGSLPAYRRTLSCSFRTADQSGPKGR